MVLLSARMLAVVANRDFGRATWLAHVARGERPRWSIVPRTTPVALPAFIAGGSDDGVLAFAGAREQETFEKRQDERSQIESKRLGKIAQKAYRALEKKRDR